MATGNGGKRVVSTESALALWEPRECVSAGSRPPPLRLLQRLVQVQGCSGAGERVLGAHMIAVSAQPASCGKLCAGSLQAP